MIHTTEDRLLDDERRETLYSRKWKKSLFYVTLPINSIYVREKKINKRPYNNRNMSNDGDLQLILGTMFSGKTTYLLNEMTKLAEINYKVLYVNIEFDSRCVNDSVFSTHNPYLKATESHHKNIQMIKAKGLLDIHIVPFDVIVVDESHFFEDLVEFVNKSLLANKIVLVAGLIADSHGNKFGKTLDLIPICTHIIRLKAYCHDCAQSKKCSIATYSYRTKSDTNPLIIDIGGADKYIPLCRAHFLQRK